VVTRLTQWLSTMWAFPGGQRKLVVQVRADGIDASVGKR
jgi:hypothetical protein